MPIAHLLAPSSAPVALGWALSLGLAAGLCLVFLGRARWRWLGVLLCLFGAGAGLSMVVVASGTVRPDDRLRLVAPDSTSAELTSPVEVHVCATTAAGSPAVLPGPARRLAVLVDGTPVGTQASPVFAMELAPGVHRLGVELVTAGHRAFSPPLSVTVTVRVGAGRGPLAAAGACS